MPIFKRDGRLHSKQLYNQFNNDGSMLEMKRRRPSSVRSPENIVSHVNRTGPRMVLI
jgi:hypothetical protein